MQLKDTMILADQYFSEIWECKRVIRKLLEKIKRTDEVDRPILKDLLDNRLQYIQKLKQLTEENWKLRNEIIRYKYLALENSLHKVWKK